MQSPHNIIDRLIPPELLQVRQIDLLFRARALIGGLLAICAIALLMLVIAFLRLASGSGTHDICTNPTVVTLLAPLFFGMGRV